MSPTPLAMQRRIAKAVPQPPVSVQRRVKNPSLFEALRRKQLRDARQG